MPGITLASTLVPLQEFPINFKIFEQKRLHKMEMVLPPQRFNSGADPIDNTFKGSGHYW